jgi:glycosyltransferase involved in cell wall biosynthesis
VGEHVVLHVLEALEGGTARHLADLVRHAEGVRHEVVVPVERSAGVTDRDAVPAMVAAGAVVHHLPMSRTPWAPGNARAAAGLVQLRRRVGPSVVHAHSSIGGALARVIPWGAPIVYTPHALTDGRAYLAVERLLARRTDRLIAVSQSEGELVLQAGLVTPERLVVIPNGIDLEPPAPDGRDLRAMIGAPPDAPLLGSLARLIPQKAPAWFVAACAEVALRRPDAHYVLIGSGPLQGELDREVRRHRLEGHFHQLPHLPAAAAVLGQLSVVALLSRFEGGPYLPLEAMRAGTPVIVTDVVGNRDVVEDGVTGFVVPPADAWTAADRVVRLLEDEGTRSAIVAEGRHRLAEHHDIRSMGRRTADVYRELRRP